MKGLVEPFLVQPKVAKRQLAVQTVLKHVVVMQETFCHAHDASNNSIMCWIAVFNTKALMIDTSFSKESLDYTY